VSRADRRFGLPVRPEGARRPAGRSTGPAPRTSRTTRAARPRRAERGRSLRRSPTTSSSASSGSHLRPSSRSGSTRWSGATGRWTREATRGFRKTRFSHGSAICVRRRGRDHSPAAAPGVGARRPRSDSRQGPAPVPLRDLFPPEGRCSADPPDSPPTAGAALLARPSLADGPGARESRSVQIRRTPSSASRRNASGALDCATEFLLAFSCKCRGPCPPCGAKRAAEFCRSVPSRLAIITRSSVPGAGA
jgi:hypothetical protein